MLVVIDTVRASLAGSEDSSENVSAYLRAVRRIAQRVPRAAFLLVHHTGWQDGESKKKRERGSSAFRGNVDATYWLGPGEGDYLEFRCLKARDDARPAPLALRLQPVEVGLEIIEGQKLTTCRVVAVDAADAKATASQAAAARLHEEERALDLSVLLAIRDKAPTNLTQLRVHTRGNQNAVAEALRRVQRNELAVAGKRGEPFILTEKGRALVEVDL